MNTLIRFFASSMVGIMLLSSCDTRKPVDQVTQEVTQPPKEVISLERAHEMYVAYQERFNALTEFRGGKEDARYGWHSFDFYKNYIAFLEYQSAKVNIPVSGLRLYYVAYPEDTQSGEHAGYQTYIFVPTYFDEATGKHIAFDPLQIGEDGKPLPIHDVIVRGRAKYGNAKEMQGNTMLASFTLQTATTSIANMGEMCKPNCPESL